MLRICFLPYLKKERLVCRRFEQGTDAPTAKERAEFAGSVNLIHLRITQMELSVHGLTTNTSVTPEEVYAAGFYGDQVVYSLCYVMARAITREQGNAAIGALASQSGAEFVMQYVHLKGYGKSDEFLPSDAKRCLWQSKSQLALFSNSAGKPLYS